MVIKEVLKPKTLKEALDIKLKNPDYQFIAGGTIVNSNSFDQTISGLISLSNLRLNQINENKDKLILGSMVTFQQLVEDPIIINANYGILKKAAFNMVNKNNRNLATIGGNIAASKSCSDLISVLLVYDAKLEVNIKKGEKKEIDISKYLKQKTKPLISKITIPLNKKFYTDLKNYKRTKNDLSILNVCVGIKYIEGKYKDVKVAIGGVAKTPIRIKKTEQLILKQAPVNDALKFYPKLKENIIKNINPINDFRGKASFKKEIAAQLVVEAFKNVSKMGADNEN